MKKICLPLAIILTVTSLPAASEESTIASEDFGDWRTSVVQIDSEEETWRECRMSTGGDGDPVLAIDLHQYEAKPPDAYPSVEIREQAPRGYGTMMKDGGLVYFAFDDGESFAATSYTGVAEETFNTATASPAQDEMLRVLQGMRRASTLTISREGQTVLSASLDGFTAAYGYVSEMCGFSTEGVIETASVDSGDAGDDSFLLFENFGVWRAQAEEFLNEGSLETECYASIPADTNRSLSFGHVSIEMPPPNSYPPLTLTETIFESAIPMAANGLVQFYFDTGLTLPGEIQSDSIWEGQRYVSLAVKAGYRDLALREMARSNTLWVYGDSQVIYSTQLDGFRETYAAIADACDFTTDGVLN